MSFNFPRLFINLSFALALTVLGLLAGCNRPPVAENPGPLRLLNLEDRRVDPFERKDAKATVFLFMLSDCPVSNRYAPEIKRLYQKYSLQEVDFFLIYPDPSATVKDIRIHLDEYGHECDVLRDPQHKLVQLTRASITPEAVVFAPGQEMVYRGRIDDRFPKFGVSREPSTHELEDVLEALVQGTAVEFSTTEAIGCKIADLK